MELTQSQRATLVSACDHEMGIATRPDGLNTRQIAKLTSVLIDQKLVKKVRAKSGAPVWRKDEQGRDFALKILKPGREAIAPPKTSEASLFAQAGPATEASVPSSETQSGLAKPSKRVGHRSSPESSEAIARSPRDGSKQAMVVGLLQEEEGATLDALATATGWLPHTTRAALTGLRKKGYAIERQRQEGSPSVYRIMRELSRTAA